jgi:hypothetical protein
VKIPALSFALVCSLACSVAHAAPDAEAKTILTTSGVRGGLIVQLGVGDGALAAALHASDSYQVQALDTDAARVAKAREAIFAKGGYGPVSVDKFDGKTLPYIDNIVNLLVAEDLGGGGAARARAEWRRAGEAGRRVEEDGEAQARHAR